MALAPTVRAVLGGRHRGLAVVAVIAISVGGCQLGGSPEERLAQKLCAELPGADLQRQQQVYDEVAQEIERDGLSRTAVDAAAVAQCLQVLKAAKAQGMIQTARDMQQSGLPAPAGSVGLTSDVLVAELEAYTCLSAADEVTIWATASMDDGTLLIVNYAFLPGRVESHGRSLDQILAVTAEPEQMYEVAASRDSPLLELLARDGAGGTLRFRDVPLVTSQGDGRPETLTGVLEWACGR